MDFQGDNTALPIYLGIATGLMAAVFFASWLRRVSSARAGTGGTPLVAILHPTPWVLFVLLPYSAYRSIWLHPSPGAEYFNIATAATFFGCLLLAVLVLRRLKPQQR